MDVETQVLLALQVKAHSLPELVDAVNFSGEELGKALYDLKEKYLIQKHPVIDGGCKTCACSVRYVYRLTFKGRQHLEELSLSPGAT